MKKILLSLVIGLLVWNCADTTPKPENLIPEDKMIDILYDLNMFQAIRNSNYQLLNSYSVNPETFIYDKYNIDSIQLAQSHKYYISDSDNYSKMLDNMINRLKENKKEVDSLALKEKDVQIISDTITLKSQKIEERQLKSE